MISTNEKLDIATLEIPEILFNQTGCGSPHSTPVWPTKRIDKGDLIICGGYPGNRRMEDVDQVHADFVTFISRVTEVSDKHLSIQLILENSYWPQGEALESNPDLGGMSGGPVYRYIESPIERLEVVGFIYEFAFSDIVFATHADRIDQNGAIISSFEIS